MDNQTAQRAMFHLGRALWQLKDKAQAVRQDFEYRAQTSIAMAVLGFAEDAVIGEELEGKLAVLIDWLNTQCERVEFDADAWRRFWGTKEQEAIDELVAMQRKAEPEDTLRSLIKTWQLRAARLYAALLCDIRARWQRIQSGELEPVKMAEIAQIWNA